MTSGIAIAGAAKDDNARSVAKECVSTVANWIVQSGAGSLAAAFLVTAAMTYTFVTGPVMWARDKYINWDKEFDDDYSRRAYRSLNI